mmetsp:Transcript_76259/g.202511  ORF Transcript_76259/g.202511 Transcript_76259/m.202511 type:complete len:263 (-) Transcript_76259:21-809(-)
MPVEVILNVYDLIEQTPICCGFFHSGIEILNREYSFAGGAGVYDCPPRSAQDGRFRQSIVLGTVESTTVARSALDRLRSEFHGDAYSLIFRNCNDFSSEYCKALLGHDIPGWVNRLARMGRVWPIRCFLPAHMKAGGNGSTPAQAPLLTGRPQPVQAPLFQGQGRSLSGVASSTGSGQAGHENSSGLFSRISISSFFASRQGSSRESSDALIAGGDSNARELRAAAAAKRFSGGDVEAGNEVHVSVTSGNGPAGSPMPNPWR